MSRPFEIRVRPIPGWLDWKRLLGPGSWESIELADGRLELTGQLDRKAAADLSARLRGVGIGGSLLEFEVRPPLHRKELRQAATEEARRYRKGSIGFSRKGTRLDAEGKFSLTPESLALEIGERAGGMKVIDACAGAGGNAIGFARAGCRVLAIELDEGRIAMARHNAKVYGVEGRIEFVCGDAVELVPGQKADLLFLDPPWGERYDKARVALGDLAPCERLLAASSHIDRVWMKVPPSFDPVTVPGCTVEAFFGSGSGDSRRVKFLLVKSGIPC